MVAALKRTLNLPGAKLIVAFASVYIVWGSTYLAIRFAIESIPTFLMAGTRFLISGILVYAYLRVRGRDKPTYKEWQIESGIGLLLLAIANGSVVMAEHTVPSGLTSLIVATVSIWMVLLNWLWNKTERPNVGIALGIVIGFIGLIVLVGPQNISDGTNVDPFGALLLLFAAFTWAAGSVYSKTAHHPKSPMMSAAMQMISGGIFLLMFSALNGEFSDLNLSLVSDKSALSLGYLIVFGSIVGFGSYVYILRHASPAHVGTYAYVNPVIAVLLGWALADEIVDEQILIAATLIIFSVILITMYRNGKKQLDNHDVPKSTE